MESPENGLGCQNAAVERLSRLIARRDGVLLVAAPAIGLLIGYVDSRPTWNDAGITVSLVLLASALAAGVSGRRPWLWALLIGGWVPLLELRGATGPASLVALVVAGMGACAGYALVRAGAPARD